MRMQKKKFEVIYAAYYIKRNIVRFRARINKGNDYIDGNVSESNCS
jgi:hypothetical protein